MIHNLVAWLARGPALGRVKVECGNPDCDHGPFLLANTACQGQKGWSGPRCLYSIDPRTILATDNLSAEGVRELVGSWGVCECGPVRLLNLQEGACLACGKCFRRVTARLLIWRGQEVDWWCDILYEDQTVGLRSVDVVILLASDPIPVERVREAKAACDEAGVGFVIAEIP